MIVCPHCSLPRGNGDTDGTASMFCTCPITHPTYSMEHVALVETHGNTQSMQVFHSRKELLEWLLQWAKEEKEATDDNGPQTE